MLRQDIIHESWHDILGSNTAKIRNLAMEIAELHQLDFGATSWILHSNVNGYWVSDSKAHVFDLIVSRNPLVPWWGEDGPAPKWQRLSSHDLRQLLPDDAESITKDTSVQNSRTWRWYTWAALILTGLYCMWSISRGRNPLLDMVFVFGIFWFVGVSIEILIKAIVKAVLVMGAYLLSLVSRKKQVHHYRVRVFDTDACAVVLLADIGDNV